MFLNRPEPRMTPSGKWSDFHIYELDSKITLFVQPTGRFKNVVLRLFVRSHLGDDPSATAVLPHVLMRGTRKRPSSLASFRNTASTVMPAA